MKTNRPIIYLITEGKAVSENFSEHKAKILAIVKKAVIAQISHIQIREKNLTAKLLFSLVSEAVQITGKSETNLIVNDRADIALAANADGVHLTENSISAGVIRQVFPENFIIGVSTHSIEKAESAKAEKANFVTYSPIFDSPEKGNARGLIKLREFCEKLNDFPVVALGGIDKNNYKSVLQAGASGFAAIRFLNDGKNLRKLAEEFQ